MSDKLELAKVRFDRDEMEMGVQGLKAMFDGLQVSLDAVVQKMENLVELMEPQPEDRFDSLVGGVEIFNTLADGRTNLEDILGSMNKGLDKVDGKIKDFSLFKALLSETQEFLGQIGTFLQPITDSFSGLGTAFSGTTLVWIGAIGAVVTAIVLLVQNWDKVQAWLIAGWEAIKGAFSAVAEWFDVNVIQPVVGVFAGLWTNIVGFASDAWAGIQSVFGAVARFFGDIFSDAWASVVGVFGAAGDIFNDIVGGVADFFIGVVNGLIDGINAVVAVPFNGINWALGIVRDIEIMGLSPFEGLKLIDVPQIPHLAQGAVLPANRPFLAMVGDQKHGTNVEAPLETIQEAVALVMGDVVASNMAGHEATVGVLREILGAVMGIEIGDEVIGRAARRYDARMAVVRGGR